MNGFKKILSAALMTVMIFSSLTVVHCEDEIKILLDGAQLEFDVPPQIIDGRTLVPMRAIFEALGAQITWDGGTQTVTAEKGSTVVEMAIGSAVMSVNSEEITLDVPPQIIDDRTLVPARAVAESFDADVEWDGETQTVIISTNVAEAEATGEDGDAEAEDNSGDAEEAAEDSDNEIPIEYDDTIERTAHYMRDFQILDWEKNSDGDYVITYKLRTFLEGSGDVVVQFRCLDANGAQVDEWSGVYRGTDYTWSWQEDTVTISGKTAKIELIKNGE
ncbi:MAG: copper amine oxidase N-terminal domain-containing protein [Firmicutes bacterium]|nr:copper amine oxidase N-terminal domain-containing protein [Bacillota bacterium]